MSKRNLAILIVFVTLLIDQISKFYIKTHFYLGEEIKVLGLNWFKILFTENNGMAWGLELGGKDKMISVETGKIILTSFRIIAVGGIVYWLHQTVKRKAHNAAVIAISLILSGAVGNIIDSVFYGALFNTPKGKEVATFLSENSEGKLFFGKVVDMLYFPMYQGESFTFFNAIFNGADFFISVGVGLLFLYNKEAFPKENN